MTVGELMQRNGWHAASGEPKSEITGTIVCDLLSWVMARGAKGTVWITVQTHLNVVAVASLHDFACVIVPDGIEVGHDVLDTADEKGVCILLAPCSPYSAAAALHDAGIGDA